MRTFDVIFINNLIEVEDGNYHERVKIYADEMKVDEVAVWFTKKNTYGNQEVCAYVPLEGCVVRELINLKAES